MQAYRAVVTAVLLYGSHSWALSAEQLERLEVLHRQHLRCFLGVRRSAHLPNEQVYERCSTLPLAVQLLQRRGRWLGHLLRMGDDRLAKQLLYGTMAGRRRRGRPFGGLLRQYTEDVRGTGGHSGALSTQQQRNPAAAAAERSNWNTLFSPNSV